MWQIFATLWIGSMGLMAVWQSQRWLVWQIFMQPHYVSRGEAQRQIDAIPKRKAWVLDMSKRERQLMADWEAAFDPIASELQKRIAEGKAASWYEQEFYKHKRKREVYVPGGGKAGPFDGPVFDAYFTPPDRDQCKLEADSLLQRAYITPQEYGQQIRNCNQEMQA